MKEYQVSGNAFRLYPADIVEGVFWLDGDNAVRIPKLITYGGLWGEILTNTVQLDSPREAPYKLTALWVSIAEGKMYFVDKELQKKYIEELFDDEEAGYTHIVVGVAPYGICSVWVAGFGKSVLIGHWQAELVPPAFFPEIHPFGREMSLSQYCDSMVANIPGVADNLKVSGIPDKKFFSRMMRQYTYRYNICFGEYGNFGSKNSSETPFEIREVKDALFDGTWNRLNDSGLQAYHESGCPHRIKLGWNREKTEYTAYFTMDDKRLPEIFEKFYGAHPQTKADIVIRIDPDSNKYEISLFRQGMREPVCVPESAFRLIVFKNRFESWRSENYNDSNGVWVW